MSSVNTNSGVNLFYGVTRYSLFSPGSNSWKTSSGGVFENSEKYMSYLFSDQRLDIRAEIFIGKALPVLDQMANRHPYKHFVLYSELLPERHRAMLLGAAEKYPFLVPVEWNETVQGTGVEEVKPLIVEDLVKQLGPQGGRHPVIWFRLDDDDVLPADYLDQLEKYRALNHDGFAISFGLGVTAYKGEHELVNLREYYHPKSAQGMAFVTVFDADSSSLSVVRPGPHTRVDKVMPTILDSRERMFFQIRHSDQDSALNHSSHQRAIATLAGMEKLPSVRASDLDPAKWPTLMQEIMRGESSPHRSSKDREEAVLFGPTTEMTFELDASIRGGLVEFEFEFESAAKLLGGFGIITFHLEGVDGIDPEVLGLRNSTKYGFSRQAWSKNARGVIRHSFILPEGASASAVTLTGKGRRPADIFIRLREPRVVAIHATAPMPDLQSPESV